MECGEEKPHCAKGLCGACYQQRWRKENPERRAAYDRRYYQKHRGRVLARAHCYREAHREEEAANSRRWQKANPEKCRASVRLWAQANPEKIVAKTALRRARKQALPDTLTSKQAEQLFIIGRATYPEQELELDHVVPLSKGGGTTLANMHAIPASLNQGKHNKLPQEVYEQLELVCK